jgi:bacterioferritin-associated ferredoxin
MAVERCICHNITFDEIQKIAKERGINSVEELQNENLCCMNCKLCKPYIELMFKTGLTSFEPDDIYTFKGDL